MLGICYQRKFFKFEKLLISIKNLHLEKIFQFEKNSIKNMTSGKLIRVGKMVSKICGCRKFSKNGITNFLWEKIFQVRKIINI